MQVLRDVDDQRAEPLAGTVVTIGAYDGVHRGHRAVIGQVRAIGRRAGAGDRGRHLRPPPGQRSCGPSRRRCCSPTSTRSSSCSPPPGSTTRSWSTSTRRGRRSRPRTSSREVLVGCLGARVVVVGEDFHFGHQRKGNVALLRADGRRPRLRGAPASTWSAPTASPRPTPRPGVVDRHPRGCSRPATSTRPTACSAGPTRCGAWSAHGDERGRELGFPHRQRRRPGRHLPAGRRHLRRVVRARPTASCTPAAISLGRRPTFYDDGRHLAARGPPPRLRRRPLRRAGRGAVRRTACATS